MFILKAKRIKLWSKDYNPIISEIPLTCTTEYGKALLKILFDYYGYIPKAVTKSDIVTKYYSTKFELDCQEWRLFLSRAKEPWADTEHYDWSDNNYDEFSVFFKKDYIPTLDEILEEGYNYFLNHWSIFKDTQDDYESFLMNQDESQEYIDLYYGDMPKLEELRKMGYKLYQDSKVLRSFRFKNPRIMRELLEEIHEIEYNIRNF